MDLNETCTPTEAVDGSAWRAIPKRWTYRDWNEGDAVLFDDSTGDTHLLSALGLAALEELAAAGMPLSFDQLIERLFGGEAADDEAIPSGATERALHAALLEFQRLGLAEPLPS